MPFLSHWIWLGLSLLFFYAKGEKGEHKCLCPSSASSELSLFCPPQEKSYPFSLCRCIHRVKQNVFYMFAIIKMLFLNFSIVEFIFYFKYKLQNLFTHSMHRFHHIPQFFSYFNSTTTQVCLLRIVHILLSELFLLVQWRPWWIHGFFPWPLLGNCWFCISQFHTVKHV